MSAKSILDSIVGKIAQSAGASVAQSPEIQAALTQAQAEIEKYQTIGYVAGGLAILTFFFYFLPRFESPIPRRWRR